MNIFRQKVIEVIYAISIALLLVGLFSVVNVVCGWLFIFVSICLILAVTLPMVLGVYYRRTISQLFIQAKGVVVLYSDIVGLMVEISLLSKKLLTSSLDSPSSEEAGI